MFGDISDHHSWGGHGVRCQLLVDRGKDAAEHATVRWTVAHNKGNLAEDVSSAA